MILHPAVSEVSGRRDQLLDAVSKGRLTAELSRYAQPGWAYVLKDRGTPALAYPSVGNHLDDDDEAGAISYVVTTDDEDRDGDVVLPMGGHLANYSKNPIVFFGHQEKPIPIGVCRSPDGRITVYPEENRMIDVIHFDREDPDADFIYGKCKRKILNATSIAFVPIDAERRSDFRKARTHGDHGDQPPGWLFRRWDKTEVSIVGVPSNPKAVGLEKDLMGACRDVWDREQKEMSPRLQKAWKPYVAQAKGCFAGWCPLPGDEKDIGGGVVLKAVKSADPDPEMDLAAQVQEAGKELENHKNPAPMPGYGQIFRGPNNELWYVGGDGDEDGFHDVVREKLRPLTTAEVTVESEGFPPKDEGWEQLYPKQKLWSKRKKTAVKKICSCDDCSAGKACGCAKAVFSGVWKITADVQVGNDYKTYRGVYDPQYPSQMYPFNGLSVPSDVVQAISASPQHGSVKSSNGQVWNWDGRQQKSLRRKSRHPFEVRQQGEDWFVYDGSQKVSDALDSREEAEQHAVGLWQEQSRQAEKSSYQHAGRTIRTERVSSGWHWFVDGVGRSDFAFDTEDEAVEAAQKAIDGKLKHGGQERKAKTDLFILWAIPAGETDRLHERPMTSMPLTREQADKVEQAAKRDGWHSFRRVKETGGLPDFSGTVNREKAMRRAEFQSLWQRAENLTEQELDRAASELSRTSREDVEELAGIAGVSGGWEQVYEALERRSKVKTVKEQPSEDISPDKACQILRDGEVDGQPLTEAQRGMFGAACARASKSWGGLRETCKALMQKGWTPEKLEVRRLSDGKYWVVVQGTDTKVKGAWLSADGAQQWIDTQARQKALTQADLDSPGVPGRNTTPEEKAKPPQKYSVGQKVSVGGGVEDAVITRVVGYVGGSWMYQVEYHIPGDPPDRRHTQPWMENQITAKMLKRKEALGQSDGRIGGYTVPPGGVQSDKKQEPLDDPQTPAWATCETCHGDGNCEACGGVGEGCDECGGSGECGECAGEGHVEKRGKKMRRKQLDEQTEEVPQLSTPQVLAALYSHAKAEAAYLDQLDDQYKDSLADYRRQQVEERMDMLKYQFSRAAGEGDDLDKMCKDFEDEHDKGMESTSPDSVVEPGEAGLVEQGEIPPEELTKKQRRKGRTMKQNTVPAEGAYTEDDPDAAAELDSDAAPFNKAAPGTEEWAEEEMQEPEHKGRGGKCECSDPGCPVCHGRCSKPATESLKRADMEDRTGTWMCSGCAEDAYSSGVFRSFKAEDEGAVVDKEDDEAEEKQDGGICMCGMEVPEGTAECPGCGAPTEKADLPLEEALDEVADVIPEEAQRLAEDEAVTDPAAEEIIERYQHPKSKKWLSRKHLVKKSLLPFLKHRVAANGQKYLVRAKAAVNEHTPLGTGVEITAGEYNGQVGQYRGSADANGFKVKVQLSGKGEVVVDSTAVATFDKSSVGKQEPALDEDEVKSLTTKLAGAIDDLKAMYGAVPKHLKPGIKHVADTVWHVGKALTDKGKEQRNGGAGTELSDKGKEQRDGGKGSELKDKGEQQGKTPTKGRKQVSSAVQQKYDETMSVLRRFGVLNGTH